MNTTLSDSDRVALDQAAALLDTLGRTANDGTVAIRCLLAAELLTAAGAEPDPTGIADELADDRTVLGQALRLLGSIDNDALDDERVLDAMQHALRAHAATR